MLSSWLHENDLEGTLPREFGQLKSLETLDLRQNRLSGPLPSELGELKGLREL